MTLFLLENVEIINEEVAVDLPPILWCRHSCIKRTTTKRKKGRDYETDI